MNRLRELRKNIKKTQDEMADILKVNRTTYGKWETGIHNPDIETVIILADYFQVSIDYFVGISNNPNRAEQAPKEFPLREIILSSNEISEESKKELNKYLNLLKLKEIQEQNSYELG